MITFSELGKFGQLGNQMFQIASTIGIASKNYHRFVFPEWKYGQYFTNQLPTENLETIHRHILYEGSQYKDILLEPSLLYDLHGYFISERYFESVLDKVNYYFQPLDIYSRERIDKIAIHVRGTDGLGNPTITHPGREYYDQALNILPKFIEKVIFTDDPAYARSLFPEGWNIYKTGIDIQDMFYMSRFHYQINAVSTFSWWAGWLGENTPDKYKVIIAPKNWYADPMTPSYDHVPERWIRI